MVNCLACGANVRDMKAHFRSFPSCLEKITKGQKEISDF